MYKVTLTCTTNSALGRLLLLADETPAISNVIIDMVASIKGGTGHAINGKIIDLVEAYYNDDEPHTLRDAIDHVRGQCRATEAGIRNAVHTLHANRKLKRLDRGVYESIKRRS